MEEFKTKEDLYNFLKNITDQNAKLQSEIDELKASSLPPKEEEGKEGKEEEEEETDETDVTDGKTDDEISSLLFD